MRIRITGEALIYWSVILFSVYFCIPIAINLLNSLGIRVITFIAAGLFVAGMVLCREWKRLLYFGFLFFFAFLFWMLVWSKGMGAPYLLDAYAALSFVFGGMVLYERGDRKRLKLLLYYIAILYAVTALTTIIGLQKYPLATRELGRATPYDLSQDFGVLKTTYHRMNIAGWSQVYGMCYAVPLFLMIWKRTKNILFFILAILIGLMIIYSQLTFGVLLTIALFAGVLITINRKKTIILWCGILVCLLIIVLLNVEVLLNWAVGLSADFGFTMLTNKLGDLQQLIVNKEALGDAGARFSVYGASFTSFVESPFAGLILNKNANPYSIGGHSDFFDILAALGISGLVIMFSSFFSYFKYLCRIGGKCKKDLLVILLGFIGLFVFNPVLHSPQVFLSTFVLPLAAYKVFWSEEPAVRRIVLQRRQVFN